MKDKFSDQQSSGWTLSEIDELSTEEWTIRNNQSKKNSSGISRFKAGVSEFISYKSNALILLWYRAKYRFKSWITSFFTPRSS